MAALGGFEHGLYAERWCPYQKARSSLALPSLFLLTVAFGMSSAPQ